MQRLAFLQDLELEENVTVGEILQRFPGLSMHEELSSLTSHHLAFHDAPDTFLRPEAGVATLHGIVSLNEEAICYRKYYNDCKNPLGNMPTHSKRPRSSDNGGDDGGGSASSDDDEYRTNLGISSDERQEHRYRNVVSSGVPREFNQHRPVHRLVVAPIVYAQKEHNHNDEDAFEVRLFTLEEVVDHQLIRDLLHSPYDTDTLHESLDRSSRVSDMAKAAGAQVIRAGREMLPGMYLEAPLSGVANIKDAVNTVLGDLFGQASPVPLRQYYVPLTTLNYKREVLVDPWGTSTTDSDVEGGAGRLRGCSVVEKVIPYSTLVVVAVLQLNDTGVVTGMRGDAARSLPRVLCPKLVRLGDTMWFRSKLMTLESRHERMKSRLCRPREEFETKLTLSICVELRMWALTRLLLSLARILDAQQQQQQQLDTKHQHGEQRSGGISIDLARQVAAARSMFFRLFPSGSFDYKLLLLKTYFVAACVAPLRAEALAQLLLGIDRVSRDRIVLAESSKLKTEEGGNRPPIADVKAEPSPVKREDFV